MKLLASMADSETGLKIAERPKDRLQINLKNGRSDGANVSLSATKVKGENPINNNNTILQKDCPNETSKSNGATLASIESSVRTNGLINTAKEPARRNGIISKEPVRTNGVVQLPPGELAQSQNGGAKHLNGHRVNGHRNYSQNNHATFSNHHYQNQQAGRRNTYHNKTRGSHHRGTSPNHSTGSTSSGGSSRYTPSPQSQGSQGHHSPRGNSPNYHNRYQEGSSTSHQVPSGAQGQVPNSHYNQQQQQQQHVVHLHVNPGEAISFQMGDQLQLINGPATVRMVSNSTTPPVPMPVQVPPGHMVQQIVDENGTLRHVILSPQPLTTMQLGGQPAAAGPYNSTNQTTGPGSIPSNGALPSGNHYYTYGPANAATTAGHPNSVPPPPLSPYSSTQYPHIPQQASNQIHTSAQTSCSSGRLLSSPTLQQGGVTVSSMNDDGTTSTRCPHHHSNYHSTHQGSPPSNDVHAQKDERTQKQFWKLKKKLEARQKDGSPSSLPNSSQHDSRNVSSPLRETKLFKDRNTSTSGLDDDEVVTSAEDEEERRMLTELLSQVNSPVMDDVTSRSAHVSWKPPSLFDDNGDNKYSDFEINESDFTYEVLLMSDKGKDSKYKLAYSGGNLECKLQDLKPATDYHSRLQAFLDDLKGQPTETVTFKTLACKPDPPNPPKLCSKTKTSLTLRWNAAADNGSKISNYLLECDYGDGDDDGGFLEVFNGQSKQYKVTKLSASSCYKFRLSCFNELGQSLCSEVVCFSTSGSVPNQPNPPELKSVAVDKISVSWIKRPNDEDFTLQYEEDEGPSKHGFLPIYNGHECLYTCNGLKRNTTYKFRLSANNEEGSSRWSDVVKYTTLPDRPGAPGKPYVKGKVQSTSFKVSWDSPKDDGGSGIQCYHLEIERSTGGDANGGGMELAYSGIEQEHVCDQLKPGTVYKLRVHCTSLGGKSQYSEIGCITSQPVSPGPCLPPRLNGKPKANSLHLKWACPEYDGGTGVTDYEIDMTSPDNLSRSAYKGRDTDCVVAGLLPGRPYIFRVRAFNRIGAGEWSSLLEVVSGAGAPDKPREPTVVFRSAQHAFVSWDEPVNNGAAITDYRLEWSHQESQDYTVLYGGPSKHYEVKGLQPAAKYMFRVQAINSAGSSEFSGSISCTTPPSSPAVVSSSSLRATSITANSCELSWQQPACNGADIVSYNLELTCSSASSNANASSSSSSARTISVDGQSACEHRLQNLHPHTSYRVRIQAVNSVGDGPFSSSLKFTTQPLPPLPPKLESIGTTHNSVKLRWAADAKPSTADFVQYCLEMETKQNSFIPVYVGVSHSHKVTKLSENSSYTFRICASNDAGDGPYSDYFTFKTSKAPPPTLKAPKLSSVNETCCTVEWVSVALSNFRSMQQQNDDQLIYQLQIQANPTSTTTSSYKTIYRGSETNFTIDNLKSGVDYSVRVNLIRVCGQDGGSGELCGAFSPTLTFTTLCKEPIKTTSTTSAGGKLSNSSKLVAAIVSDPLTDQQKATIILLVFTLFAILVAIFLQRVISYETKIAS